MCGFEDWQVIAERLAAGGAGDDDQIAAGTSRVERLDLMRIELLDAAALQERGERVGQRHVGRGKLARPFGQLLDVLELIGVIRRGTNPLQQGGHIHEVAPKR